MKNDIEVTRSRSLQFYIEVKTENGNPYSLTASEKIEFGVKKRASHENFVIVKHLTSSDEVSAGIYKLYISPNDTKDLPFGKYFYDVSLHCNKSGENEVWDVIKKRDFIISENITGNGG